MADLDRVKRNVARMVSLNAPEADIDAYIASEGTSIDEIRAYKVADAAPVKSEPSLMTASLDPGGGIQGTVGVRPGRFGFAPPGGSLSKAQPTPEMTLDARMQDRVAKERAEGGLGLAVDDTVRTFARGTPIGSWLDETNALIDAGVNKVSGGRLGMPYAERMAYEKARNQAVDREATPLVKTPLGTVDTADALKVLGGGLSVAAAPALTLMRGAGLVPQTVNATATGAAYGGLFGLGEGEGTDRIGNAVGGTAIGAGIGGLTPAVAKALSNTYSGLARLGNRPQGAAAGMEKGAVRRVAESVEADGLPARYQQRVADLGPEGMLADMGDNLRMDAARIARNPGEGRPTILNALQTRREGAPGRITSDLDAALGQAPNIPETVAATADYYRQQAQPFRQQFQNSPVPFTQRLNDILDGLGEDLGTVLRNARRYANIDPESGPQQFFARQTSDGGWEITRVPNASEWDYIKRALDGMARGNDRNDQRVFGHWARQVREAVDEAISPGAPNQSPWAQARALEAENFQIADAVEAGRGAFSKGLSPEQMRAEMYGVGQPPRGGMNPPERAGYVLGARDQIRQNMGNASTAYGPNADTKARSMLQSQNSREKLELIAGRAGADRITRRLNAETEFAKTLDAADRNSITSTMEAAKGRWPGADDVNLRAQGLRNSSMSGMAAEWALKAANLLTGGYLNERNVRIQADAARMLVAQGADRDALYQALMTFANRRNISQQRKQAIETIAEAVWTAPRSFAIERALSGDQPEPTPRNLWQ